MLLAIDIGNSFTKFGIFDNNSLSQRIIFPTIRNQTAEEINSQTHLKSVDAIIISSVVPELNETYRLFADKFFDLKPIYVDNTFDFGFKINYNPPEKVGVDRIVAAFAASEMYGKPCIICDFGTATTIDAVDSQGEYLGGTISPGVKTLAESLYLKTSQLPLVEIEKPESVFGNSTAKSIQAGIYYGYVGLVDGIVERMVAELGEPAKVVATGGFAEFIAEGLQKIEVVNENLMLEGLRLIYEKRLR
jgi:type III pantothenate kinase